MVFQKAIFKAKNAGSSLKMAFPFGNILDIEYTDAFEFQQFLKIRVVGIEDSFVMDEVSACMIKSNSTPLTLPFFLVLLCLFP
jgi:hypothetical protein